MFHTNTESLARNSYVEGKYAGIEDVMCYLNDLQFASQFTEDEQKTIKKLYRIVSVKFPINDEE